MSGRRRPQAKESSKKIQFSPQSGRNTSGACKHPDSSLSTSYYYDTSSPPKVLERCKRAYQILIHLAPGLKTLISDPSKSKERSNIIRKVSICAYIHSFDYSSWPQMNKAIKSTRADDSARLRDKIGLYAAPNPTQAALSPPICSGSKSQLGFNHPVLAKFLCPISALGEFQEDPKGSVFHFESNMLVLNGLGNRLGPGLSRNLLRGRSICQRRYIQYSCGRRMETALTKRICTKVSSEAFF